MKKYSYLLILFVLFDLGYSFTQYLHHAIDGDMADLALITDEIKGVMASPFGKAALWDGQTYPNPNRFFAHWAYLNWFQNVPHFLQNWMHPIESLYAAAALAKLFFHISLLYLIGILATGTWRLRSSRLWFAMAVATVFFQANGFRGQMGIVDRSVTYAFFYALPNALVLLYFLPYVLKEIWRKPITFRYWHYLISVPFSVLLTLNGPLNPGILLVLITVFSGYRYYIWRQAEPKELLIRTQEWVLFMPVIIMAIYSLYLGSFNSLGMAHERSLLERYSLLPIGIGKIVTTKIGYALLLLVGLLNAYLLKKKKKHSVFLCLLAFTFIYIILLPLGGHREYRPYVIRYDSVSPITIAWVIYVAYSSYRVFSLSANLILKRYYAVFLFGIVVLFQLADQPNWNHNVCQKRMLYLISQTNDTVVPLPENCKILSWENITDPQYSKEESQLMRLLNITDKEKLFFSVSN